MARGIPKENRCTATSKQSGDQCKQPAIDGGTVCRFHGGSAPQVRLKAMERIRAAADDIAAELVRLASSADSESVRLQAVKDLLDRAGFGAKHVIESEVTVHDGDSELDREIARLTAELAGRAEGRSAGGTPVVDDRET